MSQFLDKFEDVVRKTGEWAFFEQAYQCRKFLCDEDAIHANLPENIRKFFWLGKEYGKYTYIDTTNEFLDLIFNFSLGFKMTDFLPLTGIAKLDNLAESLSNAAKEYNKNKIIEMQNFFILEILKEGKASEEAQKPFQDKCTPLPEDLDLRETFHRFFLVSCKYGVYIPDLIYQLDIGSALTYFYKKIAQNRDKESLCPSTVGHIRYYDFLPPSMNKEKAEFYSHPTIAKRALSVDLDDSERISPSHKSFLNMIKNLFPGAFRVQSTHMRLVGLWLWDRIYNPRLDENLSFSKAAKVLKNTFANFSKWCPENQDLYLRRSLYNTQKCIKDGQVAAFRDQYVK